MNETTVKNIAFIFMALCILVGLSLNATAWITSLENRELLSELSKTGKLENISSHFNDDRTRFFYDEWKVEFWCPDEYVLMPDSSMQSKYVFVFRGVEDEVVISLECDSNAVYRNATIWDEFFDIQGEKFVFRSKAGQEIKAIRWFAFYKEEFAAIESNYAFIANGNLYYFSVWQTDDDFYKNYRLGEQLFACLKLKDKL